MPRNGTWMMGVIMGMMFISSVEAGEVNINKADATLMAAEIGGLGIRRAEAIVRYRKEHGAFTSVEQLADVPGVGQRIVDNNRSNLTVGEPTDQVVPSQQ